MNANAKATLQTVLSRAIEEALGQEDVTHVVSLPMLGDSAFVHMALAVINILEAIEDAEDYIGAQLPDETRGELGI
jgi:hypothetical protein